MSCFAMTEPEVAGSDPTLIQTRAEKDGDEWIINGHKWFISNARRAQFAILVARTEPDVPPGSRGANTAFLVDLPAEGWNDVREVETMHGSTGHSEIVIEDLRVHDAQILGGRGNGHRLGQYRLGPARLAHCMRWIAQAETALDMMVDRSLNRYSHGSLLAEKQGVQWLIADSAMELYQCKLMVLHAAYKIDRGDDFRTEVSMAKHFVANSLNRIIDRSMQVHGALGYSTDTPLANMLQHARWARFADGADEIHQMRIAERTIAAYKDTGSTNAATGGLPSDPWAASSHSSPPSRRVCVIFLLWIFTDRLTIAFRSGWEGILGFIFLPYTTLFYALVYAPGKGVDAFGWVIVALGVLLDLSSYRRLAGASALDRRAPRLVGP